MIKDKLIRFKRQKQYESCNQRQIINIYPGDKMYQQNNDQPTKDKSIPKSSLHPMEGQKSANIEYLKQTGVDYKVMQNSDEQKQQEMNRMRQQYVQQKMNRKKQMQRVKKDQFGSSSSEDEDVGAEQSLSGNSEQINQDVQQKIRQNANYENKAQDQCSLLSKPQKIYQLKGKQTWTQQFLTLKQKSLFLSTNELQIVKIHKIKSIPQIVCKNSLKIKISYNNQQIMIGAAKQLVAYKKERLPLHYIILVSVITRKLEMMGLKMYQLQKSVPGVPESIIKNCLIYGKIFKKSQILGRWEERLVVINELGIYSYKRFNQQHSMFITANSVKQIWTRFQVVDQNLLVIKILHSSNTKTEFGIPVTDFMNQKNWLFQFYHMGIQAK